MSRRAARWTLAMLAALAVAAPAGASGPSDTRPWYLDMMGGEQADLQRLYSDRLGVVMSRTPSPQLYLAWRLLHGQRVGAEAGAALSVPCCGNWRTRTDGSERTGMQRWTKARMLVPGASQIYFITTDLPGPDYTSIPNCFDDAFATAARTLEDRAARFGSQSEAVKAWLATQDAVFETCRDTTVTLPSVLTGAPDWLRRDRAYQEAAQALYAQRSEEAAARFAAIARDSRSPWAGLGLYLQARAWSRAAMSKPTPDAYARAKAAIDLVEAQPPGAFGRGDARLMRRLLAFSENPGAIAEDLGRDLGAREPTPTIATDFKDLQILHARGVTRVDVVDWIDTLRAEPGREMRENGESEEAMRQQARRAALAHAQTQLAAKGDRAWLLAALSLAHPGEAEARKLSDQAVATPRADPAWLTAQYHLNRLEVGAAADRRARLDGILRRDDLSTTDRNLFTAQRLALAETREAFLKDALRRRVCGDEDGPGGAGCLHYVWNDYVQRSGVYDGKGRDGRIGFGEDARAVIDGLPLRERIALSRDPRLPRALRLDLALTSYARAVLLEDHATARALAGDLSALLPQMQDDWQRIRVAPDLASRRFAEFMIFAKIPGLRTDLVDYTRPEGSVAQFQYYWIDWVVLPKSRPLPKGVPPPLWLYQADGYGVDKDTPDAATDLVCLGECGRGASSVSSPYARRLAAEAAAERRYFVRRTPTYYWLEDRPTDPPGAVSIWNEMLAYGRAHPKDPAIPESLYWLIRIGRWGGTHDHSGRRAFKLLHARYPDSRWAKRSPYYYD